MGDLECVRRLVLETLPELGLGAADRSHVHETELLCAPHQTGRRFQYAAVRAVWFSDSAVIDFFSEDGEFLKAVTIGGPQTARQAAA